MTKTTTDVAVSSLFFLLFWLRDGKYFVTAVREGGQSLGRAHEISQFKCGSRGNLPPFMRLFWFWVTHGGGFLLTNPPTLTSQIQSKKKKKKKETLSIPFGLFQARTRHPRHAAAEAEDGEMERREGAVLRHPVTALLLCCPPQ